MARRDSVVTRRLLSVLVYFLLTLAVCAAICSFPDYLQSRDGARQWRSHMTYDATGSTPCSWRDVTFVGDLWEIRLMSSRCPGSAAAADATLTSYQRHCVTSFGRHRYIVRNGAVAVNDTAAPPTGNVSRYNVTRKQFGGYACVEFVRHSAGVIQLRESTPTWTTARLLETTCSGDAGGMASTLDDWPLVDYGPAFFRTAEPCAFADGGFSIRMFDKLSRRGICDAFSDETRVESRCSADEGDRIHFRYRYVSARENCVISGLHITLFLLACGL